MTLVSNKIARLSWGRADVELTVSPRMSGYWPEEAHLVSQS